MDSVKIFLGVAVALVIVFAGAFGYADYANSQASANYRQSTDINHALQPDAVLGAAFEHWNNIAIENTSLVAPQYLDNATLQWIGGPLSGTYTGLSSINTTWNRFFNLWSAVWIYSVSQPTVSVSGSS
ncbi:MAG: hypothetical protein ACP5UV_01990, partial [Thermoplasmata archaeon]